MGLKYDFSKSQYFVKTDWSFKDELTKGRLLVFKFAKLTKYVLSLCCNWARSLICLCVGTFSHTKFIDIKANKKFEVQTTKWP